MLIEPPESKESPQTVPAVGGLKASGEGSGCLSGRQNATNRSRAVKTMAVGGRERGDDHAQQVAPLPGHPSGLGIVCIRGRIPFPGEVKIYPFGVICRTDGVSVSPKRGKHLQGGMRGEIKGLSPAAAARCREFVVTHDIPGSKLVSVTGTTAIGRTPEEWRKIMQRYSHRLVRKGVSAVWRVELQKRGAPHVHALLWVPPDLDKWQRAISESWLECIGATFQDDGKVVGLKPGEFEHAFQYEEGVGAGWVAYLASHTSKHKQDQLGWVGKQWGIWGEDRFARAQPLDTEGLDGVQLAKLKRGLRRWQEAKIRTKQEKQYGIMRRCWRDSERGVNGWTKGALQDQLRTQPEAVAKHRRAFRKVSLRPLPCAGQWVRAYAPEVPVKLLAWVRSLNSNPF